MTCKRNGYKFRYNKNPGTSHHPEEGHIHPGTSFYKNDVSKDHVRDSKRKDIIVQTSDGPHLCW